MTEADVIEILSEKIVPRHYDIKLEVDVLNFSFNGFATIDVTVKETTNNITFNAERLNIKSVSLCVNDHIDVKEISCEDQSKTVVKFSEHLKSGSDGSLKIAFAGENVYSCTNSSCNEESSFILLNPTDAGYYFPCWNPKYKATFDLTLTFSEDLSALSNMPVKFETKENGLKTIAFCTSPLIPAYCLTVILGEYNFIENKVDDVIIRIHTTKDNSNQADFAMKTVCNLLAFYNSYFDFSFPLPKLDCIDLDLPFEVSDTWGLLIFSEPCLLTGPSQKKLNNADKQMKRLKIGRKLAEQWLGALLSPKSWQELWLYDGLLTFFQYMSVSDLYLHDGSVFEDFVSNQLTKAFELDSVKETKPIIRNQKRDNALDKLCNLKTPSLIYMLQDLIGPKIFRESVASFVKNRAYKTYSSKDLWQFLEDASQYPVKKIMHSWTSQAGYPILLVEERQEGENRILSISQQRFLADGSNDEKLWVIPISIVTAENPHQIRFRTTIAAAKKIEVVLKLSKDAWVMFHLGFYRVLYCENMIDRLISAIEKRQLHELHRFSILNDLFYCAKAGYTSTSEVLNLIPVYQGDKSYIVWNGITDVLSQISSLVSHLSIREELAVFSIRMYVDIYDWVGWDKKKEESYLTSLLRSLVLQQMAILQDNFTLNEAERRFQLHLTGTTIPEYLRTCVYIGVISTGKEEYLDNLMDLFFETDSEEEKMRVFTALGAARNEKMIKKVLTFTISDLIHPKYGKLVFRLLSTSQRSREMAWHFVKERWSKLSKKYCGEFMSQLKKWVTSGFTTQTSAEDVEIFLKNHVKFLDDPVQTFVNEIMINVNWLLRDRIDIERVLCFYVSE